MIASRPLAIPWFFVSRWIRGCVFLTERESSLGYTISSITGFVFSPYETLPSKARWLTDKESTEQPEWSCLLMGLLPRTSHIKGPWKCSVNTKQERRVLMKTKQSPNYITRSHVSMKNTSCDGVQTWTEMRTHLTILSKNEIRRVGNSFQWSCSLDVHNHFSGGGAPGT